MLRVTKLADYGIIMLTFFASHAGNTYNAKDIAKVARLPLPVVSKVLKLLARAGLLLSQRGTKGGYGLARQSKDITVAEIIRALEGPIAVTECSDQVSGDCYLETGCPVRMNWNQINRAIHSALEKITLEEMAHPLAQPLIQVEGAASEWGRKVL